MRTFAKSAVLTAAAVLAGATLQLAAPGAAQAATTDYRDCPDHYLCLWGDASYAGRYILYPESGGLFVSNVGDFLNDLTTSIWNRTGRRVCFYRDANYQGLLFCMDAGGSSANIGSGANDQITSFQPF